MMEKKEGDKNKQDNERKWKREDVEKEEEE